MDLERITPKYIFHCMLKRKDAITKEVLEPVTFVLAYSTVSHTMYKLGVTSGGKTSKVNFMITIYLVQVVKTIKHRQRPVLVRLSLL